MKKTFFALFLFLALVSSTALAVTEQGSMKIYAVTTEGQGLVATLSIEIEPGTGKIWSAVTPLVGTTTQNAERTAVNVAKKFSSEVSAHDYKFTISSNASIVEGPSAGAAMTLLLVSMLSDRQPPSNVSITGTINEDGSIGAVGGVFEKVREAGKTGVKLFLIPKGE
ncbi:MAG TPA: S16 family serine protease, partial [archaeon]|nr:S16 family serine protease [archaeon]